MTVPTVTLRGPGAIGHVFAHANQLVTKTAAGHPTEVKLGRKPARPGLTCPKFADHFHPPSGWSPPMGVDWTAKAANSLLTMLGNDRAGDCVIAGRGHQVGCWTANDSDSGGEVIATTAEALHEYHAICGPGDNGCVIADVLDTMKSRGLVFGGRPHKIAGYVAVDWTKPELVKAAAALFGSLVFGINFPEAWEGSSTWDVTRSRNMGGHDVPGVKYDPRGVFVASWGRVYLMTWAAIAQHGRVDECYALLSPDWTGNDHLAPSGFDVAGLTRALDVIGAGDMPDPKPPAPPEPPPPPPGPKQWQLQGTWDEEGTFKGTATEGAAEQPDDDQGAELPEVDPDVMAFDCRRGHVAHAIAALLWPIPHIHTYTTGNTLHVERHGLSPEQWQKIMDFILKLITILGPIFALQECE